MFYLWRVGCAGVLLAAAALSGSAQGGVPVAREQMLAEFAAMPSEQLRSVFVRCDRESSERLLDLADGIPCAMAFDALLRREFGGNMEELLRWWRARRAARD
jgi:hypothetical protein